MLLEECGLSLIRVSSLEEFAVIYADFMSWMSQEMVIFVESLGPQSRAGGASVRISFSIHLLTQPAHWLGSSDSHCIALPLYLRNESLCPLL